MADDIVFGTAQAPAQLFWYQGRNQGAAMYVVVARSFEDAERIMEASDIRLPKRVSTGPVKSVGELPLGVYKLV